MSIHVYCLTHHMFMIIISVVSMTISNYRAYVVDQNLIQILRHDIDIISVYAG